MKPITRKEYYLAKAAGTYTGPTPPPVLREDYYLATLAGDYSGYCPAPVTRLDMFMSAAAELTSYVPQPITRIEMYWYAIAKGTGYVPEPVTREEKFLYAILKNPPKPEYLDKTAEGSMILLTDSAEAPFTALTVYGHSTQDGTPTPDNPVPIVSAGDSGEINVTVGGKNLLDTTKGSLTVGKPYVFNGRTYLLNADGTVDITTQDATSATGSVYLNNSPIYLPYGEYTVSGNDTSIFVNVQIVDSEDTNVRRISVNTGESKTFEINSGEHIKYIWMYGDAGTEINGKVSAQIEIGTVATAYEPYKTPQTLSLSTPGGLPGIPVSSGGNYTDENGQQWVCDEVDLARGKYVQRVIELDFNGAETWSTWGVNNLTEGITGFYSYVPSGFQKMATNGMLSNLLQYTSSAWGGREHGISVSVPNADQYIICSVYNDYLDDISTDDAAIESWKNILNTNNLHVMLILQDPIETDLTAEEIAAYKALHTYSPNTTVSNDAGAWMKMGYKAIP